MGDQRTVLHAYFNVCSKRVMDNVCMVMEDKLLQTIGAAIEMELVNTLQGQDDVRIRGDTDLGHDPLVGWMNVS